MLYDFFLIIIYYLMLTKKHKINLGNPLPNPTQTKN